MIKRRVSFGSGNKFNAVANALSGNFFPLSNKKIGSKIGVAVFILVTWIIKVSYACTMFVGLVLYVPVLRAIQESGVVFVLCVELIIPSIYLNVRRDDLRLLVRKFNEILVESDELENCIRDIVEPHKKYLKMYTFAVLASAIVWSGSAFAKILDKDRFDCLDFTVPAYMPDAPFPLKTFVIGVVLQIMGSLSLTFMKIAVDSYVSYFVMVLAAEYKFVRSMIAEALRRKNDDENSEIKVVADLRKCVKHHCDVIEAGQILTDVLAVQVGTTYINCILKFCFLGFGFITFEDAVVDKWVHLSYGIGILIQIYMLCACVQQLQEASVSVTEDAFHEDWHDRHKIVRNMFSTIELSSQMECRVAAYRTIDLTMPTLGVILSKAYSACLLLLKID